MVRALAGDSTMTSRRPPLVDRTASSGPADAAELAVLARGGNGVSLSVGLADAGGGGGGSGPWRAVVTGGTGFRQAVQRSPGPSWLEPVGRPRAGRRTW